jgi:hypothetical protein
MVILLPGGNARDCEQSAIIDIRVARPLSCLLH